jgi:hypothetical protein
MGCVYTLLYIGEHFPSVVSFSFGASNSFVKCLPCRFPRGFIVHSVMPSASGTGLSIENWAAEPENAKYRRKYPALACRRCELSRSDEKTRDSLP